MLRTRRTCFGYDQKNGEIHFAGACLSRRRSDRLVLVDRVLIARISTCSSRRWWQFFLEYFSPPSYTIPKPQLLTTILICMSYINHKITSLSVQSLETWFSVVHFRGHSGSGHNIGPSQITECNRWHAVSPSHNSCFSRATPSGVPRIFDTESSRRVNNFTINHQYLCAMYRRFTELLTKCGKVYGCKNSHTF